MYETQMNWVYTQDCVYESLFLDAMYFLKKVYTENK